MKKLLFVVPVLLMGLTACGVGPRYGYVNMPPPPPRVEVRGYAPGPGFVWVGGYWNFVGGGYRWVPGRWARPPRGRSAWVPGQWQSTRGGHHYRPGHWR